MLPPNKLAMTFVLATVALDAVGIGLIFPVMPDLMTEVTGGTLGEAALWGGLLTASFAVMQFLSGPIVGNLSDRFGRRPILLGSLAVMAVNYVVMALAHTLWMLLAVRMVAGVAAATHATALAYVADISAPDDRARRFGLVGAALGAGFVAGPMLGGVLAVIDTRAPFQAAAALACANLIFGWFILPESLKPDLRRRFTLSRANPLSSFKAIGGLPGLRILLLVSFIYAVTFNVWPALWSYYGKAAFGWNPLWIGISLAIFGLCAATAQATLVGPMIRRFGERRTATCGMVAELGTYTFFGFISSGFWALVFTPVTALGSVTGPALQAMASRLTPETRQGELQGITASLNALAMIIAPPVMTWVFEVFTAPAAPVFLPGAPFLLSAVLMVAAVTGLVAAPRAGRPPRP